MGVRGEGKHVTDFHTGRQAGKHTSTDDQFKNRYSGKRHTYICMCGEMPGGKGGNRNRNCAV